MQGCCAHAACPWCSTCSMGGGHAGRTRASACWWPSVRQSAGLPGACSQQLTVALHIERACPCRQLGCESVRGRACSVLQCTGAAAWMGPLSSVSMPCAQGGGHHPDMAGEPLCAGRRRGHPGLPAAGGPGAARALPAGPREAASGVRGVPTADAGQGAPLTPTTDPLSARSSGQSQKHAADGHMPRGACLEACAMACVWSAMAYLSQPLPTEVRRGVNGSETGMIMASSGLCSLLPASACTH